MTEPMTDPAAPRDKARAAAREREALRQRAEDADGWQRRAEKAEAEIAALAAARSGAAHRLDALYERAETAKANHDAGRRILQDLMDELAALAAAR